MMESMGRMVEMDSIQGFEDLIAWKKARALTKEIYRVSRSGNFARDFGLTGQIQRAAVSVMANIAEGFERAGLRDFNRFVCMAKSSCAEVRSHLYVALDSQYLSDESFKKLNAQAYEVSKILGGLRVSLAAKIKRQNKTM